jgi:hypothetical protein
LENKEIYFLAAFMSFCVVALAGLVVVSSNPVLQGAATIVTAAVLCGGILLGTCIHRVAGHIR